MGHQWDTELIHSSKMYLFLPDIWYLSYFFQYMNLNKHFGIFNYAPRNLTIGNNMNSHCFRVEDRPVIYSLAPALFTWNIS